MRTVGKRTVSGPFIFARVWKGGIAVAREKMPPSRSQSHALGMWTLEQKALRAHSNAYAV